MGMDAVAEVKARLNIEDVVSEYVQLKRSGRNFKGLSPWTNEKTPSFMVSPEKQIWHDFSSGKGGDMFSFVMEAEGLDFRGALELLARKAGVDLDQFQGDRSNISRQIKNRSLEALELAAKFYQKQLTVNQAALKYLLQSRGFSKKTILLWQFGYSPSMGSALTNFLTKKGFTTDETRQAGLSVLRGNRVADMFRARVMIPLANSQGQIVGFTARLLADEPGAPKYINTPSTSVYDKSRNIFGLHLAKDAIRKSGFAVIVEGNLDVISSHQAGVTNVVATAGTAMTQNHLRELKRFSGDIRLCFDADSAGVAATERAIDLAQKTGVSLGIIELSGAKDPDELIKNDPALWQKAAAHSVYALDWLLKHYASALDLTSAQGKKAFSDAILPTIQRLSDPVEQEHYLKEVASLTDTTLGAVSTKLSRQAASAPETRRRQVKTTAEAPGRDTVEFQRFQNHFLGIMLHNPRLRKLLENCLPDYFTDEAALSLFKFLKAKPDFNLSKKLPAQLRQTDDYVKIITLQYEELYGGLPADDMRSQALQLKHRLVNRYAKIQKQELMEQMRSTDDEKLLRQMMAKADKLNVLIKADPSD